nr:hypothetical protein CFP56_35701 [Quercus suber]
MIRRQTLKQYKRRCKKAMYWMEIEFVPSPLPNKNDKSQNFPPLYQCSPSYFSKVASSHVMRNEKMYTLYLLKNSSSIHANQKLSKLNTKSSNEL